LHLHIHLLRAKEDLTFLQRPIEVDELFGPGTRGAHLGEEVQLDNLSSNATGITFCAHISMGVLKIHQPVLPHGDDAFPTI
jgi:hypothetical protein